MAQDFHIQNSPASFDILAVEFITRTMGSHVHLHLTNGVKLRGTVTRLGESSLVFGGQSGEQIVLASAIATIQPVDTP